MGEVTFKAEEWQEEGVEFAGFLSGLCAPPSDEPTEEFAEKHVVVQDGPFAGANWRLSFTPLAKYIFAGIRTQGVKRVTIMMSAQYVKTMALLIDFLRNAKHDPADTMWVMSQDEQMGEFVQKRLMPYIEGCAVVAPLLVNKTARLIQFDTFNLMLRGSNSRARLQSDPIRRVYCDERREWKPGSIDLLRKRMRTFPNAMEISAGTAGNEFDELHSDYEEGTQTRAHVNCLKCGHSQPIRFGRDSTAIWKLARECGGFKWDTNDVTRPNGKWNYEEVSKTVRFECENPECRELHTNEQKYDLMRTMHVHDYNPSAPSHLKSFGGSAFEAIWASCDWDKLVVEFLKAIEQARNGNIEPMRAFITETLGEPWQDRLGVVEDFGFLTQRMQDYDFGDVWSEERVRFMAADKQAEGGEHYYWLIRAFGLNGRSRIISHGRCNSYLELEEARKHYGVKPNNSVIDSGYKANEVYRFCNATGWKPFKGDDADYYLAKDEKSGKTFRQLWKWEWAQPEGERVVGRPVRVRLFRFSTNWIKDLHAEFTTGLIGDWTLAKKTGRDYMRHATCEVREARRDSKGRQHFEWVQKHKDNHWNDCELMIDVAAVVTGLIVARRQIGT